MSSNNTPASFASAAAGQSRGPRHGDGAGDWSRREGRSTNGTMTFRRPSAAPNAQSPHLPSDETAAALSAVAESLSTQPALPPVDGSMRYSREQLLDIFRATSSQPIEVSNLFVNGWNPAHVNGATRGWGKSAEGTVPQDPTVCWDGGGRVRPTGLDGLTAEEKELFADVNSTLKPQQQKEGGQGGAVNGRKTSISHGVGYNVSSPISASRPATRRRETSDGNAYPNASGLASPAATRPHHEESSWLGRKFTDSRDTQQVEEPDEEPNATPVRPSNLGTLGRSNTAGSGLGTPSSLWTSAGQASAAASGSAIGAFGSFAMPASIGDKRFGSMRGESRLAHLLPKQDTADVGSLNTKPAGAPAGGTANTKESWRSRPRTDTDPFSEDLGNVAGGQPAAGGPPQSFDTPVKNTGGDFGMSSLNVGGGLGDSGAGSPETNPFRSPAGEHGDDDYHQPAATSAALDKGLPAIGSGGSDHAGNFGSMRGFPASAFDGSDRSQTSSVGAKGFTGLGNIAGWGNALNSGTPDRDRAVFSGAFGNSLFNPVGGDLQSPGFGSVHGVFGPPSAGGAIGATGSLRGTSKLGSLFPASMQAQMAGGTEQEGDLSDSIPDLRQGNPLGAIGRETIGSQGREPELASRSGRGLFDEFMEANRASSGVFTAAEQSQVGILGSAPSPLAQAQAFDSAGHSSTDTPPNPPRTMVMPDRMRWVYLDPQGQTQGPFTGLEMNDWYKANFFTADLRVKKVEDTEFEPLGQLIRRIGNSREPFLVPQMGVAHGQPSLSGTFAHGDRGTVIPPLVGAFPSYGRTLTAEEQNNLERRKQEEQYMLARQREMIAVSQHHPFPSGTRPPAGVTGGVPSTAPAGALHHHSSAHSLQSQPSFGSMTSPLASAQMPLPGNLASSSGFFDHAGMPPATGQLPVTSSNEFLRDEFNLQERQIISGIYSQTQPPHLTDPSARSHLPAVDELQNDPEGFNERLKEFKQLRDQLDANEGVSADPQLSGTGEPPHQVATDIIDEAAFDSQRRGAEQDDDDQNGLASPLSGLSLTQQVQKTQAAAAAAKRHTTRTLHPGFEAEAQSEALPMPFPAPQSHSGAPLAAPTAQRSRSTLPDQYASSRSQSETPESAAASSTVQPPPLAPWARDIASESHKGPSLKEIQEAEAKKAAKAEEAAVAARRAVAEQEAALQREREKAAAAAAPGLPTSSTWANGSNPPPAPSSPWSTPSAAKANMVASVAGNSAHAAAEKKKTLADIQREEEARKQKSRESSVQSSSSGHPTGKRYAELASKGQPLTTPGPSAAAPLSASGWATVGAGGKVKSPAGSSASRSVSSAVPATKPASAAPATVRSVSKHISSSSGKSEAGGVAMEEFNKWLHRELGRGITDGIDLNGFVDTLLQLPLDQTIISEAVYANSKTMDGRHFADEFIRRKKLADKGVVEKQGVAVSPGDSKTGGGWSEVAKKGSSSGGHLKEESMPAGFKVVPSRKKGKK